MKWKFGKSKSKSNPPQPLQSGSPGILACANPSVKIATDAGYTVFESRGEYRNGANHYNPIGKGSVITGAPNKRDWIEYVPSRECMSQLLQQYINTPELASRFLSDVGAAPVASFRQNSNTGSYREMHAQAAESRRVTSPQPMQYAQSASQAGFHVRHPVHGWQR